MSEHSADQPTGRPPAVNPGRRRFFREFAGEVFTAAATVVGAAQVLRDSSAQAAQAILEPERGAALLGGGTGFGGEEPSSGAPRPAAGFRTPFRFGDAGDVLLVLDQRRLPDDLVEFEVRSAADAAMAIRDMIVRGAPAIGQVAALGLALTAHKARYQKPYIRRSNLRGAANALVAARPTAINLRWAVDRLMARYEAIGGPAAGGPEIASALRAEADTIVWEATTDHGRIAEFGLAELPVPSGRPLRVLTHCNTGPLACGQFGTALGIVQAAHHAERAIHVWVDETRPYLQGARLTAWELGQAGVPHTLIADVTAGSLMRAGEVDAVLVGADRIAANGDTANKVGTYPLAVLAARHALPFYVVAPLSSVDLETPDGDTIPIEERSGDEVLFVQGRRIAPPGTAVRNPSFDVTPAELITGIVTEEGVLRAPFGPALRIAFERLRARRQAEPSPFALPSITDAPGGPGVGDAERVGDAEPVGG
ncbi:MAG TPA: S-methyl-5-thioribose-1-phosphate isomerase [Vitreimonas sp.]|nr:S-methyl-5-thioribose-1-phosphate isomerase [Vitreimonas sp.]